MKLKIEIRRRFHACNHSRVCGTHSLSCTAALRAMLLSCACRNWPRCSSLNISKGASSRRPRPAPSISAEKKLLDDDVVMDAMRGYLENVGKAVGSYVDSASGEIKNIEGDSILLVLYPSRSFGDVCRGMMLQSRRISSAPLLVESCGIPSFARTEKHTRA